MNLAMERNVRNAECIDAVEDAGARVAWLESEGCATLRRPRHVCRYWNGVPINSRNSRDTSSREELFFRDEVPGYSKVRGSIKQEIRNDERMGLPPTSTTTST
jgi:hypothetical protein